MSPREGSANGWAIVELASQLDASARSAGHAVYSAMNVRTGPTGWIQPDLMVLHRQVHQQPWIEAEQLLCPVEIISPSSFHRDRIDKPAICAGLGIPYYMHIEIRTDDVLIELLRLDEGKYVRQAHALAGQTFETTEPFAFSFDPAELLEPR
jgi:Uma2 family endonuclease